MELKELIVRKLSVLGIMGHGKKNARKNTDAGNAAMKRALQNRNFSSSSSSSFSSSSSSSSQRNVIKKRLKGRTQKLNKHAHAMISMNLVMMYFLYLYVTRNALDVFNCTPLNPIDPVHPEYTYMAAVGVYPQMKTVAMFELIAIHRYQVQNIMPAV